MLCKVPNFLIDRLDITKVYQKEKKKVEVEDFSQKLILRVLSNLYRTL
jgi:hypothetical protein